MPQAHYDHEGEFGQVVNDHNDKDIMTSQKDARDEETPNFNISTVGDQLP